MSTAMDDNDVVGMMIGGPVSEFLALPGRRGDCPQILYQFVALGPPGRSPRAKLNYCTGPWATLPEALHQQAKIQQIGFG